MSLGRISGPLLKANLQRDADLAVETDLLYIGHTDGKIGINTLTRPREFTVNGTLRSRSSGQDLTITETLNIGNLTIGPDTISTLSGNINLNHAGGVGSGIVTGGIKTSSIDIQNNYIGSHTTNADVDIIPNGTGTIELITAGKTVTADGNIHATGNITFDGSIFIGGDGPEDNVRFLGDIDGDLMPDQDGTYNIGNTNQRFNLESTNLSVDNVISAENVTIDGIEVTLSQGNIWYVAVNGDNTRRGTSPQGPLGTVKYALSQAQAGDTVFINAGDYEEEFPLEVPAGVTVKGQDLRNVEIRPTTDNQSEDAFLLNGESTVENLTIKNFYYDSVNNKGHAFRFAGDGKVTSRSPYIRNVTVITQGSATSASDPRGFASGDAGRGAYIDGSVLDHDTNEASMLFHSVTFITPGVDSITMTNGVRVEWLNSFTYFANRSYYIVNGPGRWRSDSVLIKGGELRSIGSASIYGNYGIVADGDETLAYLISHNFAYIGTGKDVTNDNTLNITANEVVKINNGKVYFQSQDQLGNFKIGDNFFVNLKDGTTSIDADTVDATGISSLRTTTPSGETTFIDGANIETGAIRIIAPNTIKTIAGPLNFASPSNTHNINSDTQMGQLTLTGNLTLGGSLVTIGNEASDTVDFNTPFDQDIYPSVTNTYDLGTTTKRWKNSYLNELEIDSFTFNENYIQVNNTNEDLELRANSTGNIVFDDVTAKNNVLGTYTDNLQFNPNVNLDITSTTRLQLPVGTTLQRKDNIADLRYNTDIGIFEGYNGGNVSFPGVYDTDRDTYFDLSNNEFRFVTGGQTNTLLNGLILETNRLDSDNSLSINNNEITSATPNADIQFLSNGLGAIGQEDLVFKNNTITNTLNTAFTFGLADIYSYLKFDQTMGLVVPYGNDAARPSTPEVGTTRFNTEQSKLFLETWNGTQWVLAAGGGESVTQEYAENINFLWSVVLG